MRAGDEHLRAAGGLAHLDDIDLDAVALGELFALDALGGGEHGLGEFAVGADLDGHGAGARIDARDDTGEDLMLLGGELVIDDAAFRLADALDDDLLCRLRRDAAEFLRFDRDADGVADAGLLIIVMRLVEQDLRGVVHILALLHDGLENEHADGLFIFVHDDLDIILAVGVVALEGGQQGLLDLLLHVSAGDALFLFDLLDGVKKFGVHCTHLFLLLTLYHVVIFYSTRSRTCAIWAFSKVVSFPAIVRVTSPSRYPESVPTKDLLPFTGL